MKDFSVWTPKFLSFARLARALGPCFAYLAVPNNQIQQIQHWLGLQSSNAADYVMPCKAPGRMTSASWCYAAMHAKRGKRFKTNHLVSSKAENSESLGTLLGILCSWQDKKGILKPEVVELTRSLRHRWKFLASFLPLRQDFLDQWIQVILISWNK